MLNRVILMGRITQDLEVRQTPSGNAVLRFNVAVDRPVRQGAERLILLIALLGGRELNLSTDTFQRAE